MQVWEMIEHDLLFSNVDIFIVYAGIYNITERVCTRAGRRRFMPPFDMDIRFKQIEEIMKNMSANFLLIGVKRKLCFLQEPGMDLVVYNQIRHPVHWSYLITQASLEKNLAILQRFTKKLNESLNTPTIWSMSVTHAFKNGVWMPIYDRLRDGLHPSQNQIVVYAKLIASYARKVYYNHL